MRHGSKSVQADSNPIENALSPAQNRVVSNFSSKIASHPESKAIISRILAGDTLRSIASDFGLTCQTLSRFKQRIVRPAALGNYPSTRSQVNQDAAGVARMAQNVIPALVAQTSTADLVAKKLARYDRILDLAEKDKDVSGWASVDRAETAALQLQAQLRGEVNQVHSQTTVQMLVYTPQVLDEGQDQAGEVLEARAVEEIEQPPPPPLELPPPPPVKPARQPKPPKPLSRMKQLQKLSAAERKQAIRLIGQGIDPFAPPPAPPPAR